MPLLHDKMCSMFRIICCKKIARLSDFFVKRIRGLGATNPLIH